MEKGKGIVTTVFQDKGFGFIRQDPTEQIYIFMQAGYAIRNLRT
jgi:cold shock CspA family protein